MKDYQGDKTGVNTRYRGMRAVYKFVMGRQGKRAAIMEDPPATRHYIMGAVPIIIKFKRSLNIPPYPASMLYLVAGMAIPCVFYFAVGICLLLS